MKLSDFSSDAGFHSSAVKIFENLFGAEFSKLFEVEFIRTYLT